MGLANNIDVTIADLNYATMENNQDLLLAQAAPANPVAQTAVPQTPAGHAPASPGLGDLSQMFFPIILIVVFYFILIRPQQKREKERKAALKKMTKGDKVITRGGIWGVVVGLREEEDIAVIKIADDVKVEVSIQAIEAVNPELETKKSR